ncbi:MAG: 6-phosphofructokinase [Monoglobales bacterium]
MKNCIVGQSGGPTAVINSSLCGVATAALKSDKIDKVFGAENGIEGVLNERFIDMSTVLKTAEDAETLNHTPSSYLGSCRFKLPAITDDAFYKNVFDIFTRNNIGYFFYIGGNDSMDTVDKLSAYAKKIGYDINIIGVPKTVDNDLTETDHTPGFGSAAKYIATTVREIGIDSDVYNLNSVTIVEIMGRNAGWLTAASILARNELFKAPHLIYLPEVTFENEKFLNDIKALNASGVNNIIVAVSEGIKYADGTYVCEAASSGLTDVFGHKNLSGTAKVLENVVREKLGFKARGVEINVSQRCAAHYTSETDVTEAFDVGQAAVKEAENGGTGMMMAFERVSDNPYKIEIKAKEISKIANGERVVPAEWIINGNDLSGEMITYLRPLIMGEPKIRTENGIPVYLKR